MVLGFIRSGGGRVDLLAGKIPNRTKRQITIRNPRPCFFVSVSTLQDKLHWISALPILCCINTYSMDDGVGPRRSHLEAKAIFSLARILVNHVLACRPVDSACWAVGVRPPHADDRTIRRCNSGQRRGLRHVKDRWFRGGIDRGHCAGEHGWVWCQGRRGCWTVRGKLTPRGIGLGIVPVRRVWALIKFVGHAVSIGVIEGAAGVGNVTANKEIIVGKKRALVEVVAVRQDPPKVVISTDAHPVGNPVED
mmetsp:Transcript_41477/g.125636  ORF Transcript_41477/g.125636 Transcript_41477/m.125636 type:complete len:250 (-) Transcript_41477:6173-6922(-)